MLIPSRPGASSSPAEWGPAPFLVELWQGARCLFSELPRKDMPASCLQILLLIPQKRVSEVKSFGDRNEMAA